VSVIYFSILLAQFGLLDSEIMVTPGGPGLERDSVLLEHDLLSRNFSSGICTSLWIAGDFSNPITSL
jgi:hypothetical protein